MRNSRIFILSTIAFLLTSTKLMIDSILAIYLYEYLGASESEVGVIISLGYVSSLIVKVPLGLIASLKSYSLRSYVVLVTLGSLANTLIPSAYALADSVAQIPIIRLIHGLEWGIIASTTVTLSSTLISKEKEKSIVYYTAALSLGFMCGPAINSFALGFFGIRYTLFLSSLISLPAIFIGVYLLTKSEKIRRHDPRNATLNSFHKIFTNRRMLTFFFAFFAFSCSFGVILAYGPLRAKQSFLLPDSMISSLFFAYYCASLISRLVLSKLSLNLSSIIKLASIGVTVALSALLMMSLGPFLQLLVLGFILFGVSHGLLYPIGSIVIANETSPRDRLLANTINLSCFDLGNMFGVFVASLIVSTYGVSFTIGASSLWPFIGLLTLLALIRKK